MLRFSPRPNRAHLVRWREWGQPAFDEALAQGKPLMLALTAFWCGYCQRLDETTLSSDEAIALLNAFFVPIRVEESQRPDVDLRYNKDGWPTLAFLTPAGDPIVTTNYLAPQPFVDLLVRLVDAAQRGALAKMTIGSDTSENGAADSSSHSPRIGGQGADSTAAQDAPQVASEPPSPAEVVAEIAGILEGLADREHGGFGVDKNKLLHTEANELFLRLFETTGDRSYLDHVSKTLVKVHQSRTFDVEDGGFFRYSSRADWNEPHPEKLLADQAGLLRNYLHAYRLTDQGSFREIAEALIAYMGATLLDRERGVFYGCQDYVRQTLAPGERGPAPRESLIDPLIYCDANAEAAIAYLDAATTLGRDDCGQRAEEILGWLWANLWTPDGVYHCRGEAPSAPGLLGDAVGLGRACLQASRQLRDGPYVERAFEIAAYILRRHHSASGAFMDVSEAGPAALRYPVASLTQNAAAASFLVEVTGVVDAKDEYRWAASAALASFGTGYRGYGAFAAGFALAALDLIASAAPKGATA